MTLQTIFNGVVLEDTTVEVVVESERAYENLRTSLVRKFSRYRATCQQAGIESYDERFISSTHNSETGVASFRLAWLEESKRLRKQYVIHKL